MLHVQAPVLIKVCDGITVNLSVSVSQAIEKQLPQHRLKDGVVLDGRKSTQDDYEVHGHADTLSFWFAGGTSLSYRVGEEITQEDFDRVEKQIDDLNFRTAKSDRKPSNDTTPQST
jgi:hypothetical protein